MHDEVCYVHDSYLKKNFVASVRKRVSIEQANNASVCMMRFVMYTILI